MATTANVRVGVGVLVRDPKNPSNVFVGTRIGSHGAGSCALPGGHLEMYETWEECAIREVMEETGLRIHNVRFGHVTNDIMRGEGKHYVTIFMMSECVSPDQRPQNLEPNKCEGWESISWEQLCRWAAPFGGFSDILFGPLHKLVQESPQNILDFLEDAPKYKGIMGHRNDPNF